MAIAAPHEVAVARLSGFRLCSARALPLAAFYEAALGFQCTGEDEWGEDETLAATGIGSRALRVTLVLGAERVDLLQFLDHPGRVYPLDSSAVDPVFQHFALVAADMDGAMQRLSKRDAWTPISTNGAEHLPASSGGVSAFKFRDPEGHPLELLAFPEHGMPAHWRHVATQRNDDEPLLGIDHSAITVPDTARSVAFYAARGLAVSSRSLNEGPEQSRLDGVPGATVEVTGLWPPDATPHVELLCYRGRGARQRLDLRANDVAATCLVFESAQPSERLLDSGESLQTLLDPDGHHLVILAPNACQPDRLALEGWP